VRVRLSQIVQCSPVQLAQGPSRSTHLLPSKLESACSRVPNVSSPASRGPSTPARKARRRELTATEVSLLSLCADVCVPQGPSPLCQERPRLGLASAPPPRPSGQVGAALVNPPSLQEYCTERSGRRPHLVLLQQLGRKARENPGQGHGETCKLDAVRGRAKIG
jgi:hypothetical protein